jgi:phage terminase small subunit
MAKRGPKGSHIQLVGATESADATVATPTDGKLCVGRTKRGHFCRKPAGQGTEHPGVGNCRHHDGQVEEGSPCPLPLTDLESRLWDQIVAQLTALRLFRLAFWPHIYGLVIALAGLHTARQSAIGATATVKGANGAIRKHPSSTVTNQMLAQIRQFSNDLGLNPSALAAMDLGGDPTKPRSKMEGYIRGRR